MRLRLVAVGDRQPAWVNAAVAEYTSRLPRDWRFGLVEVPVAARGKNADIPRLLAKEGERMLSAVPERSHLVAFDERGRQMGTRQWADAVSGWQRDGQSVCMLIGGPDGLSPECRDRATATWALSRLTLPHGLARVLVLEQLYRAWSLLNGHPYHRD